ncbi:hypothetical protein, partial [Pseudorhodoplanes sp.]|uniref:hypothetical protein n=1 Tax=Pseudorhodoplanes sp. TaxID=1934341 RepID=UPI002D1D75C9
RDDPKNDEIKCMFRDGSRLTCIKRDLVMFGKPVRTKDYTIIPVYDDCGGSACGLSQTTLLIEKGTETKVDLSLRRFCVQCKEQFVARPDLNEIDIALDRREGHEFSALFRDGAITISKKPLDPNEPLSDDDCKSLYEDALDSCMAYHARCRNVVADLPGATRRSVNYIESIYAAFPSKAFASACDTACRTKKRPARAAFDKDVCRRK